MARVLVFGLLVCLGGLSDGCSSASKKSEPKELAKLALDAQEEAQKLRDDGNLQASVAKYQEALRYHPSPSTHTELGDVLARLNKTEDARAQYQLALAKNPGMPEAQEALDRLEAKSALAEQSLSSPVKTDAQTARSKPSPKGDSSSAGESAKTASPTDSRTPPDIFEEDRLFKEMAEIQPPRPGPRPEEKEEVFDEPETRSGADALMADTEAIYGTGRGSQAIEPDEEGEVYEEDLSAPTRRRHTVDKGTPKQKPLKGGRGLLNSLEGTEPQVSYAFHAGAPQIVQAALETGEADNDPLSLDTSVAPPPPKPPKFSGRPGERGLTPSKRLPSHAPPSVTGPRERSRHAPKPPVQWQEPSVSEDLEVPPPKPREKKAPPKSEKKGIMDKLLGPDDITYPEPPTPEREKPLPSPYVSDREVLDMRPFRMDRLKGKPKAELDLEVCKDRYYKEKDLEGSVRCFNDKKIDFPDNPVLYYELALVLEDAGDYTLARKNLEMAIRYDSKNQEYRNAIARLDVGKARERRLAADYLAAVSMLLKTIEKHPDMAEAYRELGKTYSAKAVSLERSVPEGSTPSGETELLIRREWMSAEGSYQDLLSRTDGDYKDWYNLGLAMQKQNDDSKTSAAIKAYEKALELRPDYGDAHRNLARLYEQSNVQKAFEHYETGLRIARNMPKAEGQELMKGCLRSLGELHWRTGNNDKAAEYLTEYIQYAPNDGYVEQMLNQITAEPM